MNRTLGEVTKFPVPSALSLVTNQLKVNVVETELFIRDLKVLQDL